MTTYETLLIKKSDGVAVIALNRPTKRNAMNPTLHRDMTAALEELRSDDAAKVIVITGATSGIGLSTGTGRLLADLVTGRTPEIDARPFRVDRPAVGGDR